MNIIMRPDFGQIPDAEDAADLTQPATQAKLDPRRLGRNNSGLSETDVSDVLCILTPASDAAFRIVQATAERNPQHILQNVTRSPLGNVDGFESSEELDNILFENATAKTPQDLALRFSSNVINPALGFCFGRHLMKCDVNLDVENQQKRVSNQHFRIYVNQSNILMLEDMSTNGTVVDGVPLGGKKLPGTKKTRMLNHGSTIEILSMEPKDLIKFLLRIPSRDGHVSAYRRKFQAYMEHVAAAEGRQNQVDKGPPIPDAAVRGMLAAPLTGPPNSKAIPSINPPGINSEYGMHWNGGDEYTCTAVLGKGAFATVYQLATKMDGELFAVKELEKRRFMKNGILDTRLDNEMQIMKSLRHPNIVQYINYRETENHLYIIMEYISCGDLAGYMQAHRTVQEPQAKEMTRQVLSALKYLHEKNITHRDIKPDNIMICSESPFVVKLTDFGLSKVIKNNETFLKTFCGTLLYCAPEVFPHYDAYVAGKRNKRRRRSDQLDSHRYSQLVDIWSYAAVLWYVLCNKPPFEGVTEGNGKGMFNKIMETHLDTSPLVENGVSKECIDLLLRMLNTDPTLRPSEAECLQHPWLNEGAELPTYGVVNKALAIIPEGEEDLDASGLSIHESASDSNDASDSQDSPSGHNAKRLKGEGFLAARDGTEVASDSGFSLPSIVIANEVQDSGTAQHHPTPHPPARLFGEIRDSALRSSGLLGVDGQFDSVMSEQGEEVFSTAREPAVQDQPTRQVSEVDTHGTRHGEGDALAFSQAEAAASLLGAESMVRELNMASPQAGSMEQRDADEQRPQTPQGQIIPATDDNNYQNKPLNSSQEVTPRQPKPAQTVDSSFSRQISLPVSASFFYLPEDPSTHNLEYASRVSGLNFLNESTVSNIGTTRSLPDTAYNSGSSSAETSNSQNKENEAEQTAVPTEPSTSAPAPAPAKEPEFIKPAPRLGRLTSTPESHANVVISLTQRVTTWGRAPGNTQVYAYEQDTRIPKYALELTFHARGIEEADKDGSDWTRMEDLNVFIRTHSRHGIRINGVLLPMSDTKGRVCFGRLYSGDQIRVSPGAEGPKGLTLACEFLHGACARKRTSEEPKFVVEAADPSEAS